MDLFHRSPDCHVLDAMAAFFIQEVPHGNLYLQIQTDMVLVIY